MLSNRLSQQIPLNRIIALFDVNNYIFLFTCSWPTGREKEGACSRSVRSVFFVFSPLTPIRRSPRRTAIEWIESNRAWSERVRGHRKRNRPLFSLHFFPPLGPSWRSRSFVVVGSAGKRAKKLCERGNIMLRLFARLVLSCSMTGTVSRFSFPPIIGCSHFVF